jgi:MFS family permease
MDMATATAQNLAPDVIRLAAQFVIALFIFVLGWVVAVLASRLLSAILKMLKLEAFLKSHKVEDALGSVKVSDVLAKLAKYYVLLIFLQAAVAMLDLGTLSIFLMNLLFYLPVLIGAALIVLLAVLLGEYLKESVIELSPKSQMVKLSGRAVKAIVVIIGLVMGFATAGFNTSLVTGVIITIVQAAAFGIALAVGIAFGLGGQDEAKDLIKSGRQSLKV